MDSKTEYNSTTKDLVTYETRLSHESKKSPLHDVSECPSIAQPTPLELDYLMGKRSINKYYGQSIMLVLKNINHIHNVR